MNYAKHLNYYLENRISVLYQRRYKPHWRDLNVFMNGATISKEPKVTKTPVHFESWIYEPDGAYVRNYHSTFNFKYGLPFNINGLYLIANGSIVMEIESCPTLLFERLGSRSRYEFELADPTCIEQVINKFKLMFPVYNHGETP